MATINLGGKKKRDRTYNKTAYQKVYQDKRWKRLRKAKLRNNPLCEECEKEGRVSITEEIHHIRTFDIDGNYERLAFDYDNLMCLCKECHYKKHI